MGRNHKNTEYENEDIEEEDDMGIDIVPDKDLWEKLEELKWSIREYLEEKQVDRDFIDLVMKSL
jgi:predicted AlkP superfamily phosphohydrolase/phosphomutase